MPSLSTNNQFNIFLENDIVDFEQVNANWNKLDAMNLCIESGTKTANYSGGSSGTATWWYRKYVDGSVDMGTCLKLGNLICSQGSSNAYKSSNVQVYLPINITKVDGCWMHMASETIGFVCDVTGSNVVDNRVFCAVSISNESSAVYKEVYITLKGRVQ